MTGTILYVDDDSLNLTVMEELCAGEFELVVASGGPEALRILRERDVAVVLADQRMPEMTGVELLDIVSREYPDTIRLLVTAYSDVATAIDAINRGRVRRYIRKPWDPDEILATLREALAIFGDRRKLRELERRLTETERVYALGVVAASLAHELRSPIAVIVGALDMGESDLASLSSRLSRNPTGGGEERQLVSEIAESLAAARRAAQRVADIVEGVSLTQRRTESQSADLSEVVRLTLASLRNSLARRAKVEVDVASLPPVSGSPAQIGQVVLNLLVNAMQALPEEPGREDVIRVRASQRDARVLLEIEDTGRGIPPEFLGRVFHPFFTTKPEGGTGLGLAISRKIVEEIGGELAVTSELGRGSCFSVAMPVAADVETGGKSG
jgi:two-component system, NtrC family, sensor kinase